MIIAIDGTSGSGKSTLAKKLAKTLGFGFFSAGDLYRTITLKALNLKIKDDEDGDLTYEQVKDKLVITGMPEDLNVVGEYKITISYADSDGNQTQNEFTLKVVEPSMAWMWILIAVGGGVGFALLVILIIAIKRRRYMRI